MRITRAAKVAAFPLIVLALVALVACQGGPGTKGDKGDKGDMGDMGMDGGTGVAGTNALSPATDGKRKIINFDVDSTSPIDLGRYFTGGKEPRVFKVDPLPIGTSTDNGITIDPEDVSGSMLPLTVTKIAANAGSTAFEAINLVVTATDADLRMAMNTVTIKRNAPPTFPESGGDISPITVGVQEGMRPDAVADCGNMLNFCIVTTMFDAPESDTGDKMDYTITPNTGVVSVSATDIAGEVKITGLTATSEALTVKITATDEGLLTVDSNEFSLSVNAAPTVKRAIAPVRLKSRGTTDERTVVFVIDSHFDDSDDLTFMLVPDEKKAHDGKVADVDVADAVGDDNDNTQVTVTAQGAGQTMVYLMATEATEGDNAGIGQSVEASFMVTVD